MSHNCTKCGVSLVVSENITQNRIDNYKYVCRKCQNKQQRDYKHRVGICKERNTNKDVCHVCCDTLVVGVNVTQNRIDDSQYICRTCENKYVAELNHRTGRCQPMSENRECASFLGVHVAERVLSHIFKNVIRMPINNPGFDFRCSRDYLVDAKSSCWNHHPHQADNWQFHIDKNKIAEYFICIAFDNRENLTPEHIWLIPSADVNDNITISIAESMLDKWSKYEHPIDRVILCCNTMR